jgi:hypothetical protein
MPNSKSRDLLVCFAHPPRSIESADCAPLEALSAAVKRLSCGFELPGSANLVGGFGGFYSRIRG